MCRLLINFVGHVQFAFPAGVHRGPFFIRPCAHSIFPRLRTKFNIVPFRCAGQTVGVLFIVGTVVPLRSLGNFNKRRQLLRFLVGLLTKCTPVATVASPVRQAGRQEGRQQLAAGIML